MPKSRDHTRVGLIGCGTIAVHAHIPAYARLGARVQLVGVYDTDPERVAVAAKAYAGAAAEQGVGTDLKVYDSVEELLSEVDAVDICTPVRWHASYAVAALKHGVHAMSEKPMARTYLEALAVVEAAVASRKFYQLNDDNLFIPAINGCEPSSKPV